MNIDRKLMITGVIASAVILHTGMSTAFAATDYRTITADNVNFRSGPSTSYSSLGKLNEGDKVEYIGESGSWVKVKYNDTTGYVYGSYVSEASSTTTKYVTASNLNVRSSASTSASILGTLSKGTAVKVISESNGWAKISYNNSTGYVSTSYLSSSSSSTESTTTTKYVTASNLNVRSSASTSASILGTLSKGTAVKVISESNGWAKISYNNSTGYVSTSYLSSSSSSTESTTTTKYVTASNLNVRSSASTSASILGTLSKGTAVKVISESNGWAKISYNNSTGYVSSSYLSTSASSSSSTSTSASKVISYAKSLLGMPYVWGAQGPSSFDCSGYTYYVFKNAANITIPRTSAAQSTNGTYVSKSNLQSGDLVFFDTSGSNDGNVSHVGIYIGNNQFIHCSSSKGEVVISQLDSSYYSGAYVNARRVL